MNRKYLLIVAIYAALVWWWLGSWGWGAAALLFGLVAVWLCSSEAK